MTNNTDQVRALADELQQAAAGEDIPSAAAAYADCAGRLRTLAKSLASAPPSAPVGVDIEAMEGAAKFLAGRFGEHDGWAKSIRDAIAILSQQPAAPSGEAVAWLRMKPDGTPDWAEDCIGSDDKFLDHEMASDGYYLQPLYAAPQQPAGVDGDTVRSVAQHIANAADYIDKVYPGAETLDAGPILRNMRRWHERLTAALAQEDRDG